MVSSIAFLVLLVTLIAAVPAWPYNRGWGFAPSGVVAILLALAAFLGVNGWL